MGKLLVRITIILTALYLALSYLFAQFLYIDILIPYYTLLFELCVVVYTFSEGKYHCKYMKYTALSILIADAITMLDNALDFMSVTSHNIIPIAIISGGIIVSSTLALRHFINVLKLKKKTNGRFIED